MLCEGLRVCKSLRGVLICQVNFFGYQVINHGISLALVESAQKLAREFFNLPLEEKQKYAENPNDLIPQGYGRGFRMPESTILDWHDVFLHYFLPLSLKNISTWPHKPAAYRYCNLSDTRIGDQEKNSIHFRHVCIPV
jgi:hypothetical protein